MGKMNKYGVYTNLSDKEYYDHLETLYSQLSIHEQIKLTLAAKNKNISTLDYLNIIYKDYIKNAGVFPD